MKRTLLLGLLAAWLPQAAAEPQPDLDSRRAELATLEHEVASLKEQNAARRAERARLLARLERSERDVASLARAEHQLGIEIDVQQRDVDRLQRRLADETQALASERQALSELFRAAYAAGRADRLRLLLHQEAAARLSRLMAYYDYVNAKRQERIARAQARAEGLVRLAEAAQEEVDRLQELAERQTQTRQRLEKAQAQRSRVLAELERTIATGEERVAALQADTAALRDLISRLEQTAQIVAEADVRREPMPALRGRLPWPVQGRPVVRFGAVKARSRLRWDGVILNVGEGVAVRAVHTGRVAYADWLRGFGLLLIIDHGEGFLSLYGNNQALLKQAGEWVAAGEPIALSGRTGGRGVDGLYFGIRRHGEPLDPAQWCSDSAGFAG